MDIIKLTVGEMEENCYIITGPGDTAIVIDPGAAAELIAGELDSRKLSLRKILLTHGHFDHIGAAQWLREHYYAPVYVGGEDEEMLSDRKKSGADMLPYAPFHPVEADARLKDGDVICEGSMKIKVIATPGHSKGSVCYMVEDCIFTGDTLFQGSVGRTDLYGGDPKTLAESLKKLTDLQGEYRLFCGHGEDTTLSEEKSTNPFILYIMK